jgi:hypothetical protein
MLGERHYGPDQIAEELGLSEDSVRRMFENEDGVLIWENPERSSTRRRRTMKIPQSVYERVYQRLSTRRR